MIKHTATARQTPRAKRRVIGMAEMAVSADVNDELITYALGSCLGIAIYDPIAKVGGMLHVMLPESKVDRDKARMRPLMFIDTGVPLLFKKAYALGAQKSRLIVKVAGGASVRSSKTTRDSFRIGARNITSLKQLMWRNKVLVKRQDVGGDYPRTMSLFIANGDVLIRTGSSTKNL